MRQRIATFFDPIRYFEPAPVVRTAQQVKTAVPKGRAPFFRATAPREGADYLQPTTTRTEAAFGFAEAPLTRCTRLQLGARVENVHVDGTPASDVSTSRKFTPISASAGIVV